jgi:hypothetical protein
LRRRCLEEGARGKEFCCARTRTPERESDMGIGSSIVVFAVGAILRFAVSVSSTHVNVRAVGVILMIVGAIGFAVSIVFWSSWGGFGGYRRQRTVVGADGVARQEREEVVQRP